MIITFLMSSRRGITRPPLYMGTDRMGVSTLPRVRFRVAKGCAGLEAYNITRQGRFGKKSLHIIGNASAPPAGGPADHRLVFLVPVRAAAGLAPGRAGRRRICDGSSHAGLVSGVGCRVSGVGGG